MGRLKLNRNQLAKFLGNDHEAIRQFEVVFDVVDSIAPGVTEEVVILAGNAEAKAQQGLDAIPRIELEIALADASQRAQEALDSIHRIEKAIQYLESAPSLDVFNIQGNAASVTVIDAGADTTTWPMLATSQTGNMSPATDAGLTYDAATNAISTTTFVGALQGNADTATTATNTTITDDTTTNATMYLTWVTAATGDLPQKVSSTKLSFNPSTGILTASGFSGPLTGNVTGDVTGSSGSCTGNSATVTTNADLTGPITSVGNATSVASQTGTGSTFVMSTAPTVSAMTVSALTANRVVLAGASGLLADSADLTFNGTTVLSLKQVHIGTGSPVSSVPFRVQDLTNNDAGIEIQRTGAASMFFISYNRTAGAYTSISYSALDHTWSLSGTPKITLSSTGLTSFLDTTDATATNNASVYLAGGLGVAKKIICGSTVRTGVYTVATLPAGTQGDRAMVSDALGPAFGAAVVGGGAVVVPVYYAAAWMVG